MEMSCFLDSTIKTKQELLEVSPLVLAFLGDSIHTLFVREYFVKHNNKMVNAIHKSCSEICKAEYQSKIFDMIKDSLSEEEDYLARRTRNTKAHHKAKNASEENYKKATMYESLLGYNYLIGNEKRLQELLNASIMEEKCK